METPATGRTIYTVSELSQRIKDLIERQFADVWVEGEVSNLRRSAAGHIYFTLKDGQAQLPAVCFRSAAVYLRFKPENGGSFRVRGRVGTYEARGEYQIIVEVLEPAGRGELQAAFDRLKETLDREGLFRAERKRPLPPYPARIGVVTSPGSAALRDILSVLARRHDALDVLIYPTEVQGGAAAGQIAQGIDALGAEAVDVVIVTRGGGSIEDLWPFNEEVVARAIVRCPKPVISAVGHETDFVISDFAADLRAPTPSAAAEIVARSKRGLVERLEGSERRLHAAIRLRLVRLRHLLAARAGGRGFTVAERRLQGFARRVDEWDFRLRQHLDSGRLLAERRRRLEAAERAAAAAVGRALERAGRRLTPALETLHALSPLAVLARGYAVCRRPGGPVVRSSRELGIGDDVEVRLHEGALRARVTETQ